MGFTPQAPQYKLIFEDPKYAGLEVLTESVSTGEFMKVTELAVAAGPALAAGTEITSEAQEAITELFRMFAGVLVSWNLEDRNGHEVPPTYEGLMAQKLDFNMDLILAWMDAVAGASPNLPGSSPSGATSLEESLDLASSSRNLAN